MLQSNIVVDYIANFTAQRDQELLSFSLLQSVNNMMSSQSSMILTLDKRGNVLSHMTLDSHGCNFYKHGNEIADELITACERMSDSGLDESNFTTATGVKIIRSIFHNRKVEQFLLIDSEQKFTKVQSYVLSGILNIYQNFLALLNDSQTDELTGLANRKTFDSAISKVFEHKHLPSEKVDLERRKHNNIKYWLAIIDIDHFKSINDNYGHLYGDEILIHLSQIIKTNFRNEDLQFRFGGEEFVILLQAPDQEQCYTILERFRENVEQYNFPDQQKITVSIGVVEFIEGTFHVTSIDYADQALYYSKNHGRNQVTFYEALLASNKIVKKTIDGGDIELF